MESGDGDGGVGLLRCFMARVVTFGGGLSQFDAFSEDIILIL
jgi:hypothetical protein